MATGLSKTQFLVPSSLFKALSTAPEQPEQDISTLKVYCYQKKLLVSIGNNVEKI